MCEFKGRLIAWMDGELPETQSAEVERHVRACPACRERIEAYEATSREFAAYYAAATPTATSAKARQLTRWVPVAAAVAAAAALIVLALLPRSALQVPPVLQVAVATPPAVEPPAVNPRKPVQRTPAVVRRKPKTTNWAMVQPAIQIAIPADAMFPPGAVPEGISYVANLSLASDGSVQGVRLQQ